MPGSVANAAPSGVFPKILCAQFRPQRRYPILENEYKDGVSQRSQLAATSRKAWSLVARLTPANLATLRTFYYDADGTAGAFYYYDPFETTPKFSYDGTGVETDGRHVVRFDGPWQQGKPRGVRVEVSIVLLEIA